MLELKKVLMGEKPAGVGEGFQGVELTPFQEPGHRKHITDCHKLMELLPQDGMFELDLE